MNRKACLFVAGHIPRITVKVETNDDHPGPVCQLVAYARGKGTERFGFPKENRYAVAHSGLDWGNDLARLLEEVKRGGDL